MKSIVQNQSKFSKISKAKNKTIKKEISNEKSAIKTIEKLKFIIVLLILMLFSLNLSAEAASRTFGIQEYRKAVNGVQYGYKINTNNKIIWKIVEYNGTAIDYSKALYCLKAEVGFYGTGTSSSMKDTYNQSYDFKNLNGVANPVPSQYYNQVLWILNHAYISGASTASSDKATLLANAGVSSNLLTDDDIDVIQQLALWYYTNYSDPTYHQTFSGSGELQTILRSAYQNGVKGEYYEIEDNNRSEYNAMEKLFKYFINNAANATSSETSSSLPLQFSNDTPSVTLSGSNYILGPYKVNKLSETPYTVNFSVTNQNGGAVSGYTILNSNKQNAGTSNLSDMIGKTFYLSIPVSTVQNSNITNIKVAMNGTYTTTNAVYWTKAGDNSVQPIVEINKTPQNFNGQKEVGLPTGSNYNLKLLKVDSTNNKALQGATFKITKPDGSSENKTTGADGTLSVGPIAVTAAGTDTITVEETGVPSGYQKIISGALTIKVTKALQGTTYKATGATLDGTNVNNGASLNWDGNSATVNLTVKNAPLTGSNYNLKLLKVDSTNNKALQGATFKITKPDGSSENKTTGSDGTLSVGPIAVTAAGTDTITVEETGVPSGYQKIISGALTIKVTKALQGTTYKATGAILDGTNVNNGASLNWDGNSATVNLTVKNAPLTGSNYNLKLLKVDSTNNKALQGATFKITKPDGSSENKTTGADGTLSVGPIAVTATGTDTITVEETGVPSGYQKIISGALTIKVTKALQGTTYKATGATLDGTNVNNGASLNWDGNSATVNLTVKNAPLTGSNYNLKLLKVDSTNNKALQGATFKITKPDGSSESQTTGADGTLSVGPIAVTAAGTDTITVEETGVPSGYQKIISGALTIKVTKALQGTTYKATGATLDGTNVNNGASLNWDGNSAIVNLTVKNAPLTGSNYNLKLLKVDSTNNKALQGATFKITKPDGSSENKTTGADGTLSVGPIAVTAAGTDTITVEETGVPSGYQKIISGALTIKVTKALQGTTYKATGATLDGTNVNNGASLNWDGNSATVNLTVKNAPSPFDLALRKYITKVNGTELTGNDSRVPNIDKSTLNNGTTATYKHKKNPVAVKTGDVVTYKLTVYNEGQMDGRATKIQDQLPTGLQFKQVVSGNFVLDKYDQNTNLLSLKRKDGNTDNLKKYDGTNLSSETVEIEATVVEKQASNSKILTNVAWISEEYNAETNETITDQKGKDRDSEPSTHPNVNKDNMSNYKGNDSNKDDLSDKDYYYKGQQDDDDFEKLILQPVLNGQYRLKLLKVDSTNNKELQGAKFKITSPNANGEGTRTQEYITDQTGTIDIGTIAITQVGTDVITIEETEAPTGYGKLMTGPLTIKVEKVMDADKGIYKASKVTSETMEGTDVKFDGNTGIINVTITNKPLPFDLALRKFITKVNTKDVTDRIPQVSYDKQKNHITYNHKKDPVLVKHNDVVTYTIRIFNEGERSGYANLVKDDIPSGLEFLPDNEINKEYRWQVNQDGKSVSTDYLSKEQEKTPGANLIKAFDGNKAISDKDPKNPDYRDVKIAFKVTEPNGSTRILVNTAEIQDDRDESNNPVDDIDSTPNNNKEGEDDIDKEYVKLGYFDLALRKFITGVNDGKQDTAVTNRIPKVTYDKDKNHITYNHTKDPVLVEQNNIVTYTIRVFNEGTLSGYANLVKDDIPDGLEFLPDNEINKQYRWVKSQDGKTISTDYLSKEQEKTPGANLIKAFDKDKEISEKDPLNPDYRDVKVAFKVLEPNTSDRIIINTAEIEDDRDENNNPVDDIDSTPNNNNEWNKEDDLDKEFIRVKYFDLALKKWVSKSIVTNQDGSVTETPTGHTGGENPEPPAKVDLGRQDINKVTVKFEFQIKVTNEGEIAGYAKEVTDYIPDGLKFVQADNPNWYERESLNGKPRVATKALENTLLQPGQSATVSIILTWINGQSNMGLKTNIAEISKDYNDSHTPDIDSTPDNDKEGEDDIDTAPVMLTVKLGDGEIAKFIIVGFLSVAMLASGTYVIKRYAL